MLRLSFALAAMIAVAVKTRHTQRRAALERARQFVAARNPKLQETRLMNRIFTVAAIATLLPVVGLRAQDHAHESSHQHQNDQSGVPLYDNLGSHHYEISTKVPQAQAYFDQGMRLYYAFNHAEAIRSFKEAQRLDPDCAMCWWGEALAWGPNINLPMDSAGGEAANAAIPHAVALEANASARERALIHALAKRYGPDPIANRLSQDSAYARSMADVVRQYPEDIEASVLFAEALMDLRPWNYWTEDGREQPGMTEAFRNLRRVLEANPNHPGGCHFFIHAVEKVHPRRAIPCAERLAGLMPGAGHIVHMPGHIYIRVGRYLDAITANEHAVHADESYIQDQRPGIGVYTAGYYPHNYDFMAFAASMIGRSDQAIMAADRVAEVIPTDLMGEPGFTFLQHYGTRNLQLRVRFGKWDDLLDTPAPDARLLHARAMWNYATGRALAAQGNLEQAEHRLAALQAAAENPALEGATIEPNTSLSILQIASHVLEGWIAAERNDFDKAIAALTEATRLEGALLYGEPPEWTVPVRHDLGVVLMQAGRFADAERIYREDLGRFPDNGWSLFGLAEALEAQGKTDEARPFANKFRAVWQGANPPPKRSTP